MIDAGDKLAMQEVAALYAHLVDTRQFDRFYEVFTRDAVVDVSDMGLGDVPIADLIAGFTTIRHALCHSVSSFLTAEQNDGSVVVTHQLLALLAEGRAACVVYEDTFVRTLDGWRIRHRKGTVRREDRFDEPPVRQIGIKSGRPAPTLPD